MYKGHLTKDSLVAGSSGGAIAATLAASDGCTSQAMEIIKDLATDKEFNKDKAVGIRNVMLKFLPSTDTYLQCNNRLHVTVTQVSPKFIKRALVISEYKSNEDLAAAVSASCYIPMWSNIGVSTDFRDTKAIDGGGNDTTEFHTLILMISLCTHNIFAKQYLLSCHQLEKSL